MAAQGERPEQTALKDALREVFRKEREAAGLEDLAGDSEYVYEGLGYEEACALFSQRTRALLQSDADVDVLECRTFLALLEDRSRDFARLLELMRRRNALRLVVIAGGKSREVASAL